MTGALHVLTAVVVTFAFIGGLVALVHAAARLSASAAWIGLALIGAAYAVLHFLPPLL